MSPHRSLLALFMLSTFLTPFLGSAVTVGLQDIGLEFGLDVVTLGWVATGFLLSAAVFLLPFGRLGDLAGRPRVFRIGVTVFTAASALCALAPGGGLLIAARLLQGLGSSMMFATTTALVAEVFPPEERGKAIGLTVAAVYLGGSLGPVLGGFLTHAGGWRTLFVASAALGLLVLYLARHRLPAEHGLSRGETFDLPGAALYAVAATAGVYGLTRLPHPDGYALLGAGLLVGVVFWFYETRRRHPLFQVVLFRVNRVFSMSSLAALVNYAATSAVSFLLSLYMQGVLGWTPRDTGFLLLATPALMTVVSPFAGRASDRIEPRLLSSLGMGLVAVALFGLGFLGSGTSIVYLVACLAVLGLGFGLFSSPNTNAVLGSVDKKTLGTASAMLGTMRLLGQMLSMGIAVLVVGLALGDAPVSRATSAPYLGAMQLLFFLFAGLCALGVFASLARGSLRREPVDPALAAQVEEV